MATPGGVAGLVGWVALRDKVVRITVLVVEQRWVGWFLVRHTVRVATL